MSVEAMISDAVASDGVATGSRAEHRAHGTLLVLQGPVGGYFGSLARHAQNAGYTVINVHFNLADRLLKSGGENIVYRGTADGWEAWLRDLCRMRRPDAIILFGDRRPPHIAACHVAEDLKIPVYSFEEGYIRPDFVTLERGGNNARSPLPQTPLAYGPLFGPDPHVVKVGPTFWRMTAAACSYFVLLAAGKTLFPHYTHHRVRPLFGEAWRWVHNAMRKLRAQPADRRLQQRLIGERSKQFFVVALQVHDDLQAIHHGGGWSQERLVEHAIRSFAAHAPGDCELVLRCHPYDRGHRSYDALVARVAAEVAISDRVHLMQSGHGPTLLMHARGMVTVNSTMGLSAMHQQCPVYALGESFYRMPGLAAGDDGEGGLAAFWRAPAPIDTALYQAFVARLRRHAMINGSFYSRRHWAPMTQQLLRRIALDGVGGVPLAAPAANVDHRQPAAPVLPMHDWSDAARTVMQTARRTP